MEGGEFRRKTMFQLTEHGYRPIHLEQTTTDLDNGETMSYDTNMPQGYISEMLKKYSDLFKRLFRATWSRFADEAYATKGGV